MKVICAETFGYLYYQSLSLDTCKRLVCLAMWSYV
jgi:hypothetical protein